MTASRTAEKAAPAKAAQPAKATPAKAQPVKAQPAKAAEPAKVARPKATDRNAPSRSGTGAGKPLEGVYTLPRGFIMRWAHGTYDLLKLHDPEHAQYPEGIPAGSKWIVTCNLHGTMTAADNATHGDKLGSAAGRPGWCRQCRSAAASGGDGGTAPAKAPAKKAEPTKAQAPKPGPPAKKQAAKAS